MKKILYMLIVVIMIFSLGCSNSSTDDNIWPYNKWYQDFAGYGEVNDDFDNLLKYSIIYISRCHLRLNETNRKNLTLFDSNEIWVSDCNESLEMIISLSDRENIVNLSEEYQMFFLNIKSNILEIDTMLASKNLLISAGIVNDTEWYSNFEKLLLGVEAYMDEAEYLN